ARLKLDRQFTLLPGGTTTLSVQTAPEDLAALKEEVQFKAGDNVATMIVQAPTVEPGLTAEPPFLRFERMAPGSTGRMEFQIINRGTRETPLKITINEPFALESPIPATLAA